VPDIVDLTNAPPTTPPAHQVQQRLFAGDILIFRNQPAIHALVAQADRMIRDAFPETAPQTITQAVARDPFVRRAAELRRAYGEDDQVLEGWRRALGACGLNLSRTYWDQTRLRINTPGDSHHSRRIRNLPAHRDSWGSMLPQQINWWAPIYPVQAGNSLLIYPDAWDRMVDNDSATWDLQELQRLRAQGDVGDYPLLPNALNPAQWGEPVALLPKPGDIVAFSAAHLHASAINQTGQSRYNIEGRTLDADAFEAGDGAPDADAQAPHVAYHWFTHCVTGDTLAP